MGISKFTKLQGHCPVCGTSMVLHLKRGEALTLHKCTGCTYALAMTDEHYMVVPGEHVDYLVKAADAMPCGYVESSSFSQRYSTAQPITESYIEALRGYLDNGEDLDPADFIEFLDIIDDVPRHTKGGECGSI